MPPVEVILVHGLYHQPMHMDLLARALRARGVLVHVPRLHRGSLAADTAAVQEVVDGCGPSPAVVGHSYGGAVISGLDRTGALTFLAAFVPDVGESCAGLGGADAPVNAQVRPHPDGGTFVPADAAVDLFYGDCENDVASWATDLLVPQASGHGRGRVVSAAWKAVRSHYVVCAQDQAMSLSVQERMAVRCSSRQVIAASHSPYISRPEQIADIICGEGADRGAVVVRDAR